MDRKLFFSYIQNMQQNNPDMIGFQNSRRKNSWQKPMSLIEQTNSLRDNFENYISDLVHGAEGQPGLYHSYMESLPKGIVPTQITGFHHDPNSAHSGTGFKKIEDGVSLALDAHDALSSLGDRAKGRSYRDLSDVDQERVRDMFVNAMSQRHQAEMMEPDQDEIDMTTDALEKQGRYESYNRLSEAVLRTGAPGSYTGTKGDVNYRQIYRTSRAGRVLTSLMDPTHPINNDPAHADERESLIRALTDMGYFPNKRDAGEINYGRVSGGRDMEFLGAPANDPTRTGPGTASANVQDLRRYAKFADKRIYDRVYTGPTPPGFMKPTDE